MSPLVANIFVYGDSLQPFLVAIVVPDVDQVAKWAKQNGVDVAANPKALHDALEKDMRKYAEREGHDWHDCHRHYR